MPALCSIPFKAIALATLSSMTTSTLAAGNETPLPSLKKVYETDFLIGAALNRAHETRPDVRELVAAQFNTITSENDMKPEAIQHLEGKFTFEAADKLMAFAEAHGIKVIGHTLAWNHQTPGWFFEELATPEATRAKALERLETHIKTLVGRYKGRILGWDVVNEAFSDNDDTLYHKTSPWVKTVGPDYIEKAFEFAHAADPDAELYYNDYNVERPDKLKKVIDLVKRLQSKGLRIDGVGIQGHWGLDLPLKNLENAILQLKACGVKVMLTELDMNVLPSRPRGANVSESAEWKAKLDPYKNGCPPELLERQAKAYGELFVLLKKHRDAVDRVTFWGFTDAMSWLDNWPIKGRTNHPLPFDRDLKPKPAFFAIIKAAEPGK